MATFRMALIGGKVVITRANGETIATPAPRQAQASPVAPPPSPMLSSEQDPRKPRIGRPVPK